ncbi:hypothetical protein CHS0354_042088 [Potamilus streckersoni]|uniref:Uncharacterized protein n=1 Tax=Potamilus streckersoni TaxID=2493646 RepID=A0AAE0WFR9_9BIVA|nr:hypothetical protein CHS0354_042088 [Potamilus streckersoni]
MIISLVFQDIHMPRDPSQPPTTTFLHPGMHIKFTSVQTETKAYFSITIFVDHDQLVKHDANQDMQTKSSQHHSATTVAKKDGYLLLSEHKEVRVEEHDQKKIAELPHPNRENSPEVPQKYIDAAGVKKNADVKVNKHFLELRVINQGVQQTSKDDRYKLKRSYLDCSTETTVIASACLRRYQKII